MRVREIERERSTTWLRNTGVGREMLRLIRAKGAPVRRIFTQLAELGVPCSMTEGLVGHTLKDWASCKPAHEAKLQALWSLAEAYTDVANCEPGAVEGLEDVVLEAKRFGVYYDPPSCAAVVIERRAKKLARFVEYETHVRPGRSLSHDRFWRQLMQGSGQLELHPEFRLIVELRLSLQTVQEIAKQVGKSQLIVKRILQRADVQAAIAEVKPVEQLEMELAIQQRQRQAEALRDAAERRKRLEAKVRASLGQSERKTPGRPRTIKFTDAWVRSERARGRSVQSIANELGISKQALTYRLRKPGAGDPPPP